MQAFLQRVINGGVDILREYASGRGRFDLCVKYPLTGCSPKKYPIELKLKYSSKTEQDGLEQLCKYIDQMGEKEGWIFDHESDKTWDEKIYNKTLETPNGTIDVVGA